MVRGYYMIFVSQDDFTYHLQQHKSYPLVRSYSDWLQSQIINDSLKKA